MNLKELYQEIILDHGKNPRNLRKTKNFTKDAKNFLDKSKNIMKDTNSRKASGPRRVSITPDVKKSDEELIIKDLNQHIKNLETIPVTLKFNSMNM